MELTLTALIKAIILDWGRGSSSGDKQLETQKSQANSKCSSSTPLPASFRVTIDCTLVGYSNLTGSTFFLYKFSVWTSSYAYGSFFTRAFA